MLHIGRPPVRTWRRRWLTTTVVSGLTALLLSLPAASHAWKGAQCQAQRCAVQAAIDQACPCASFTSNNKYQDCVKKAAKAAGLSGLCRKAAEFCAENSLCGKTEGVVCIVPGKSSIGDFDIGGCSIVKNAKKCTSKHGVVDPTRTSCCKDCAMCAGAPCTGGGDCTSQFCDDQTQTCAPVSVGGSCRCGGDCTSQHCDDATHTCAPNCAGGPCLYGGDCTSQHCDDQTHLCAPVSVGGSCRCGGDCTSQHCDDATHTCAPNCAGGPCLYGGDCTSQFCDDGTHLCGQVDFGGSCRCGGDCYSGFCRDDTHTCG